MSFKPAGIGLLLTTVPSLYQFYYSNIQRKKLKNDWSKKNSKSIHIMKTLNAIKMRLICAGFKKSIL